ncbi:hypothetical protein [Streptomyces xanthophaeus]|uniref:hypothetical protein n=1 Tax=Streptomyces xanthophaeus TaxID=67385 RepID=UPI002647A043|nr:hypothetical protein [Streptomyces xanthophaeus]WKD36539.1 hypothetical protein KO717_34465 [Streptomyces xanthophaeus]
MLTLLLAAAATAGYLTGRIRPAQRLSDWAERLPWRRPGFSRREWRWWAVQPVYACQIAVLLTIHPRQTIEAWQEWRTRNDPRPPAPVPRLRTVPLDEP